MKTGKRIAPILVGPCTLGVRPPTPALSRRPEALSRILSAAGGAGTCYECAGTWFKRFYGANGVYYRVVPAP